MATTNNKTSELTDEEYFKCIRNHTQQQAVKKFRDSEKQKTKEMKQKWLQ